MDNPFFLKAYRSCLKEIFTKTFQDRALISQFFFGLVFLGIGVASTITLPFFLKRIVDSLSSHAPSSFSLILISYGLLWGLSQAFFHLRALLTYKLEQRMTFVLGLKVLSHLFSLCHNFFLEQKPGATTNVIRRAQRDVPAIMLGIFFHVVPTFLEFSCIVILMFSFYPFKYSFLLSIILGTFFVYTLFMMKSALRDRQVANRVDREADGIITDWLSNYEAIRIFGQQGYALNLCAKELKNREVAEVRFMANLSISRLGQSLILGAGLSLLTYLIGQDVLKGALTVGDFILFNGYILQFILPINTLGQVIHELKKALLDMKEIMDILLTESTVKEVLFPTSLKGNSFSIKFENISFRYKDKSILENVSFTIEPEETVLIIGSSGIGKSTLINLLMRTYDPTKGNIFINQQNIKNISFKSLTETISLVPQNTYFLNDTIKNNLQFVRPQATFKDIEEALDKADLLTLIKTFPTGINTFIGDKGLKLSGGEKQKLSLARLFLKKPKICIFDEPTSSLDRKAELIIQKKIETFLPKTTKIIITHRPFMFEKADQIITLLKDKDSCKLAVNSSFHTSSVSAEL